MRLVSLCWTFATTGASRRKLQTNISSRLGMQELDVEQYLLDTVEMVDPTFEMGVTKRDRKVMVAALMGIDKSDVKQKLRETELSSQWEKAKTFVDRDLLSCVAVVPEAPDYQKGIETMQNFKSPAKFFSFLARGRVFQGKFDRLLESKAPHLLSKYENVVSEMEELDCLRKMIESNKCDQYENLIRCIELDMSKASSQPADGGLSSGKKGELDLNSYLETRDAKGQCIYSVLVKPPRSKWKPGHAVIETTSNQSGTTSEFDAMVIEQIGSDTVRILELWEAKATIHPATLSDVIFKKVKSFESILLDEDAVLILDGVKYSIDKSSSYEIGIFGSEYLLPKSAARRIQVVAFQKQLRREAYMVVNVLDNGRACVPDVIPILDKLLLEVKRLKPKLIIG